MVIFIVCYFNVHEDIEQVLLDWDRQCLRSDDPLVACCFAYLIPHLWRQRQELTLGDGDLRIHCTHIDSRSHLGVVDQSGGSKWHIWFLCQCWLWFRSDIVGGRRGIHCIFSSGKWVYRGLVVIVDFLQCSWRRWRKLSQWYWWCDWYDRCWCRSGSRSFGWCQSICGWVGIVSLLGSRPNSRCWFMGTQSEQLLFKQQDMLFQGELENANCRVG